ncbi:MAG: DUF4249 domain-containing protein [Phaeodactylibacter sp.]|nr:DUF4249 domain-containing protein [Phaeodactylibacter sp.]MCB9265597.1 DUF4249 domain-containing protein [Lewinellaceae bacterium]MCB9290032.1 DUF4249 domain-containing protein [Lewinellaceae bacterium]
MKTIKYLFPPLLLLAVLSCRKDVNIKPKGNYESQLFIEGILYPGEQPRIYLSLSQPFFNKEVTPQEMFARGAEVRLSDGAREELLHPDSTYDKFRCRWVPYYLGQTPAEYGKTYELRVAFLGKTYTATTTISQAKVDIEEVEYTSEFFDVYGGHDGVILRFRDAPGQNNFYRFQMDRFLDTSRHHAHILEVIQNDCTNGEKFWITDLGRTIFRDENNDGQPMEMYAEVSFEYRRGDTAYIYLQSLDETSAAFYEDIDNQLQSILNPFVEPVFLKSTIEGTLGVFGSVVRSDTVLFVYPQDNP